MITLSYNNRKRDTVRKLSHSTNKESQKYSASLNWEKSRNMTERNTGGYLWENSNSISLNWSVPLGLVHKSAFNTFTLLLDHLDWTLTILILLIVNWSFRGRRLLHEREDQPLPKSRFWSVCHTSPCLGDSRPTLILGSGLVQIHSGANLLWFEASGCPPHFCCQTVPRKEDSKDAVKEPTRFVGDVAVLTLSARWPYKQA